MAETARPPRASRLARRLVTHHLPLAAGSLLGVLAAHAAIHNDQDRFRWSMATAYVGLALLAATVALGPLNVVRRRPNPVSSDLRRDVAIWAGIVSLAHVLFGFGVHMKGEIRRYFMDVGADGRWFIRHDPFGLTNVLGVVATLVIVLLLALSNDWSLRSLGTARWKWLQQWTYPMLAMLAVHGAIYQLLEKRQIAYVALFAALCAAIVAVQWRGWRAARARRAERAARG